MASTNTNNPQVASLCRAFERALGVRPRAGADFQQLSERLHSLTGQLVSATTLKRIWGYNTDKGGAYQPSLFSLNVLSRAMGFRDFEDFLPTDEQEVQSAKFFGESLRSDSLAPGTRLRLRWRPDRMCMLRHTANNTFVVEESLNGRLTQGDVVELPALTQSAPALMTAVRREGCEVFSYLCGAASGVTFEILPFSSS